MPIEIDPRIIPWSYRGSYLCLANRSGQDGRLTPAQDIYLVSHNYPGGLPLFALRPGPLGPPNGFHTSPSPVDFSATPSLMTWKQNGEVIAEATFQDDRTIRMRGRGEMSFDTEGKLAVDQWRCWIFKVPGSETAEFVSTPNAALRFEAIKGSISLENVAPFDSGFKNNNRRISISGEEWELLITERDTEKPSVANHGSFADYQAAMEKAVDVYTSSICPWRLNDTDRLAAYVMWTSTVRAAGFLRTEAVLMSKLWMDKVWSWDNTINGVGLIPLSLDRALDQILLPWQHITPEGRLPDSMTRSELLYDYTKPPIYGWGMFKVLEADLPKERLREVYDKVTLFTNFWFNHRNSQHGVYYTHANDSGWDNATAFDKQTVTVSPDFAGLMIVQLDFLARAAKMLDLEDPWIDRRDDMISSLMALWNGDRFLFKDALSGATWSSTSLLQFIPLVASAHLDPAVVDKLDKGLDAYLTEWGLATEELGSELYEPDGYWRGPIWAPSTILIESGLRWAGKVERADEIAKRFIKLCERSGFAENYDAETGEGNRDLSYTWSASAYLTLRRESEQRQEQISDMT